MFYLHRYDKVKRQLDPEYHLFSTIDLFTCVEEDQKIKAAINGRFLRLDDYIFLDTVDKSLLSLTHLIPKSYLENPWRPLPMFQVYLLRQNKDCIYRNDSYRICFHEQTTGQTSNLFEHPEGFKKALQMYCIEDSTTNYENKIICCEDLRSNTLNFLVIRYSTAIRD